MQISITLSLTGDFNVSDHVRNELLAHASEEARDTFYGALDLAEAKGLTDFVRAVPANTTDMEDAVDVQLTLSVCDDFDVTDDVRDGFIAFAAKEARDKFHDVVADAEANLPSHKLADYVSVGVQPEFLLEAA